MGFSIYLTRTRHGPPEHWTLDIGPLEKSGPEYQASVKQKQTRFLVNRQFLNIESKAKLWQNSEIKTK